MADKEIRWMGDSLETLKGFPEDVKDMIGHALRQAQRGLKHPSVKPLKGFRGGGVLEVVEDHDGDAYRAVYTVKIANKIYVLHAFKKKSAKGISTPRRHIELIKARYNRAEELEKGA